MKRSTLIFLFFTTILSCKSEPQNKQSESPDVNHKIGEASEETNQLEEKDKISKIDGSSEEATQKSINFLLNDLSPSKTLKFKVAYCISKVFYGQELNSKINGKTCEEVIQLAANFESDPKIATKACVLSVGVTREMIVNDTEEFYKSRDAFVKEQLEWPSMTDTKMLLTNADKILKLANGTEQIAKIYSDNFKDINYEHVDPEVALTVQTLVASTVSLTNKEATLWALNKKMVELLKDPLHPSERSGGFMMKSIQANTELGPAIERNDEAQKEFFKVVERYK